MEPETGRTPTPDNKPAVEHLTEAHTLLQELRKELAQHPQLEDAIQRIEMALSILTTKTGGML